MTRSMALDWGKDNIQVNVLLPGWITTPMTEGIPEAAPERYKTISDRIPAGRWGVPADMAGAAVFLASRASDYVTGSSLVADGGYSAN